MTSVELEEYNKYFLDLYNNILETYNEHKDQNKNKIIKNYTCPAINNKFDYNEIIPKKSTSKGIINSKNKKEIVVISGKGGTGKTTLTGCFSVLSEDSIISDCDVDAADLHLLLEPDIKYSEYFYAGISPEIDEEKCNGCGICYSKCKFEAITMEKGKPVIDSIECEGCGVCVHLCPNKAITGKKSKNGIWYISESRAGVMTHAELFPAKENSGNLVTLLRKQSENFISDTQNKILIDGAPGTGCPVVASITNSDYAVIVTEPTLSGMHDCKRVIKLCRHFLIPCGIIINKCDINEKITNKIIFMASRIKVDYLGKIKYNKNFIKSQIEKKSFIEYVDSGDEEKQQILKIRNEINNKINSSNK